MGNEAMGICESCAIRSRCEMFARGAWTDQCMDYRDKVVMRQAHCDACGIDFMIPANEIEFHQDRYDRWCACECDNCGRKVIFPWT